MPVDGFGCACPRVAGWHRLLFLPVVIADIVLPLQLTRLYTSFSRRNAPFLYLVDSLPRGKRVFVVVRGMMRQIVEAPR